MPSTFSTSSAVTNIPDARVAVVHDWFQGFHGSERVVEAMVEDVFADARERAIYTFHAAREVLPPHLSDLIVGDSALSRLPGIRQQGHDPGRWRLLLPYMPHYFRNLPLDDYDIVISSSHSCAIQVRPRRDALHLCYCYTPMRYAWMPEIEATRVSGLSRTLLRAMRTRLRRLDHAAAQRPDGYLTLSNAVRDRIRLCYGRDATVIYPPVDTHDFDATREKQHGHFLWVHRMVPYKQPLLVAEAFRGLPYELTMVGVGPLHNAVRQSAPSNVRVLGWVERDELSQLFSTCSGFIHIGEEDFGISMVEAMAAGMPVIGLNRGGARDIVRDGVDGVLIEDADTRSLRDAVRRVAGMTWEPHKLAERADDFSRSRFDETFGAYVSEMLASKR